MRRYVILLIWVFMVFSFSCQKLLKKEGPGVIVVTDLAVRKADSASGNNGVIFFDLDNHTVADSFRIPGFSLSTAIYSDYYNGFGYLDIENVYHITDLKGKDKISVKLPYHIGLVQPGDKGLLYCIARTGSFDNYFAVFNPETEEIDLKTELGPAAFSLGSSFYDRQDTGYFFIMEGLAKTSEYVGIDPNTGQIKYRYSLDNGFFSNVTYDPTTGNAVGFYVDTSGNIFLVRFDPPTGKILSKVESEVIFVSACQRSFDTERGYYIAVSDINTPEGRRNAVIFLSLETGQIADTIILDHRTLQIVYKPKE